MSAKPYTPEELDWIERTVAGQPRASIPFNHNDARWLATLSAARAEALEEAARVCDGPHDAGSGLDSFTCAAIGATIRALAQKARGA